MININLLLNLLHLYIFNRLTIDSVCLNIKCVKDPFLLIEFLKILYV